MAQPTARGPALTIRRSRRTAGRAGRARHRALPELPEARARGFLRGRADGHVVTAGGGRRDRVRSKTLRRRRPHALVGGTGCGRRTRHGKWAGPHGRRDADGRSPLAPGLAPVARAAGSAGRSSCRTNAGAAPWCRSAELAARAAGAPRTTASGFDLTEAGTRKRLAVHVVDDPTDVPPIAPSAWSR